MSKRIEHASEPDTLAEVERTLKLAKLAEMRGGQIRDDAAAARFLETAKVHWKFRQRQREDKDDEPLEVETITISWVDE